MNDIRKLKIGQVGTLTKTISESDVNTFANISGDYNPIHIDEDIAKKSIFGHRIVHGFLAGSLISAVIGTEMPGEGTIYLEQDMMFKKPIYIGDTCTAKVVIYEIINKEKGIYRLSTEVINQNEEIVIEGFAVVKVEL
ncbi:MaoC family dehydratase [Butyrivibrio fibrisolvens]|uniref:MaoC family dehydratase n=1 Tax=Butyrivibrio fibrisolvens TaxID=831 RepID=UPI000488F628|nr:MaoC family dehydratase [Butyrivibrio fibrisolvens]